MKQDEEAEASKNVGDRLRSGSKDEVVGGAKLRFPDFRSSPFGLWYGFGYTHNDVVQLVIHLSAFLAVRINWKLT